MTKTLEPIVFFGSGPVAAESLRLLSQDCSIEAVVTKPRAPHHKGSVPVIELAEELGLKTYTVTNRSTLDELIQTDPFTSRLSILIDFGIIVSQNVIDYFDLGIINSHFSLLPEWRGADPITFSILSGQKTTGISLMLLTAGMDEGPLLAQSSIKLDDTATTLSLTQKLIILSNKTLKVIVPRYITGQAVPETQEKASIAVSKVPTYSRKLTKDDGIINWAKPAVQIEREIRAYIEWPRTRTTFNGLDVIITRARTTDLTGKPGTADIQDKSPVVYCGEGALIIDNIQPAGKKEMTGEEFLAGYKSKFL